MRFVAERQMDVSASRKGGEKKNNCTSAGAKWPISQISFVLKGSVLKTQLCWHSGYVLSCDTCSAVCFSFPLLALITAESHNYPSELHCAHASNALISMWHKKKTPDLMLDFMQQQPNAHIINKGLTDVWFIYVFQLDPLAQDALSLNTAIPNAILQCNNSASCDKAPLVPVKSHNVVVMSWFMLVCRQISQLPWRRGRAFKRQRPVSQRRHWDPKKRKDKNTNMHADGHAHAHIKWNICHTLDQWFS